MCLAAQRTETHGAYDKMLDDALYRLHLVYVYRIAFEVEEVAYEYRRIFLVNKTRKLFIFLIAAHARGKLKG